MTLSGALSSMPVPDWSGVSASDAGLLESAFDSGEVDLATVVAERLYGVEPKSTKDYDECY
jgi:hypothetical protein